MGGFVRRLATICLLLALALSAAPVSRSAEETGPEWIAELQRELNRLGYRAGKMNGVTTESTRRAIRNFERVLGRAPKGQPTQAILEEVRKPCAVALDERGYKKASGGCPRPASVNGLPDAYLIDVGRGEEVLKLEPLESEGW
jgi:peptidoglycan hydrolase-like protein with peptidoglycan-binding domain